MAINLKIMLLLHENIVLFNVIIKDFANNPSILFVNNVAYHTLKGNKKIEPRKKKGSEVNYG